MSKELTVALAGIGGYGENYVKALLQDRADRKFVAAADPAPERCKLLAEIKAKGIPVYPDLESLYKDFSPSLTALASPIQLHRPQSELALARGSHVLCEKPAAGSLADAEAMLAAEKASKGLFLAIGYQWSYSTAVLDLKKDILAGRLGRPLRLRSLILWPRALSYYQRNSWAGALKTPGGLAVNDSPLNNATAHYLHNCLFLLGSELGSSAQPERLRAELARVNRIQNFDTVSLRLEAAGAEILFLSSHATRTQLGPICSYEFENATVSYEDSHRSFVARFKDGSFKNYGNPEESIMKKLDDCAAAARDGGRPVCAIETALAHTRCVEATQRSSAVLEMPEEYRATLENGSDPLNVIKGLPELMTLCYAQSALPSECGLAAWAKPGELVKA
jgi:predicted dehydrogenase